MNKTKLITGIVLFAMTLVITVSSCFYGNEINNDVKLTEDKVKALQSVNADIITKSVNQVSKLSTNVLNTNTAATNNLLADTSEEPIVIESNDSIKITKKKSKSSKSKKKKQKKSKKTAKNKRKKKKSKYIKVGTFKVTGYCSCARCCGKSTGITASGTVATAGRTIAADTSQFSFGSKVVINGHTYTVEDRGGAIRGNRIDIFFSSHSKALDWGVRYCDVYVKR